MSSPMLSMRRAIARFLLSTLLLSLFLVFYVRPTAQLTGWSGLALVLVLEFVAFAVGLFVAGRSWGGTLIRTLVLAFLLSGLVTYFLQPVNQVGFELTFVDILVLEALAVALSFAVVRGGRRAPSK